MIWKLWAKLYLWCNNVCTKHYEGKESDGNGGSYCKTCQAEDKEATACNISNAINILKG